MSAPARRREPGQHVAPVPTEAPLAMPVQDLTRWRGKGAGRSTPTVWLARLITFGGALLLTAAGAHEMSRVVGDAEATPLQGVLLALFAISFGWIALSASGAVAGLLLRGPRPRAAADAPITGRTALVMPVYNEDPARSFASLRAMAEDLADAGYGESFEIFVLSDTNDPDAWVVETAAYGSLRRALAGRVNAWYRRRHDNRGKKAGNIADFVRRWGARYDFMVVLDADSLMATETLVALAREMEADPKLGILQTVPVLAGGTGLFARLQQFAGRLYGPIVARGVAAWQGDDGNYWGHNAIIRVRAFAAACGLPELSGRRPFGGPVMSHDFVEAALMRRAGWSVRMLPDLGGSWEECPPSLLDAAARDRRWAQGNLQHVKIVPAAGLTATSRVHLVMGIMSYLASPLWLALIVVGLVLTLQAAFIRPEYFSEAFQIFPRWPRFDIERMIRLFLVTLGVLLLPRALGLLRGWLDRRVRRPVGIFRLGAGAVVELIVSALYAPIWMMMQTRQIWEIVRSSHSDWSTQQRGQARLQVREVLRRHWLQTLAGLAAAAVLWVLSRDLLAWMSPTLLGLGLAIPLSLASGSAAVGLALRRGGLLVIPEEVEVPHVMRRRDEIEAGLRQELEGLDLQTLIADEAASERHFEAVLRWRHRRGSPDPARLTARMKLAEANDVAEALDWLDRRERMEVLSERDLFQRLRSTARRPARRPVPRGSP
jgi:membrane glycosyltransferase